MRILISFFVAMLFSMSLAAAPMLDFKTSYDGSSVEATPDVNGLSLTLSESLKTMQFSLEVDQSQTFDFFDINLPKFGTGTADIAATLDFLTPASSGTGQGTGSWLSVIFFSAGELEWVNQPGLIELVDGSSFELSFAELSGIQLGTTSTVKAKVTARSIASVPEPGTLALLGMGLLAMGFRRQK